MQHSESIEQIGLALAKAQGELSEAGKDAKAHGYQYATLASVLDVIRPVAAKYEIAYHQSLHTPTAETVAVELTLIHKGEWLQDTLVLPLIKSNRMNDAQAMGASITYGRRYQLAAAFGISQADTDAAVDQAPDYISEKQYQDLLELLREKGKRPDELLHYLQKAQHFRHHNLRQITQSQLIPIREIIARSEPADQPVEEQEHA